MKMSLLRSVSRICLHLAFNAISLTCIGMPLGVLGACVRYRSVVRHPVLQALRDRTLLQQQYEATQRGVSLFTEEKRQASSAPGVSTANLPGTSSISSSIVTNSATAIANVSTTLSVSASASSVPTAAIPTGQIVYQIGPFECTTTADFGLLTTVMSGYLQATEDYLKATMQYLVLNLHAAAPTSDPRSPASKPDSNGLPAPNELLSQIINDRLSLYTYNPTQLLEERTDLNHSWYSTVKANQPDPAYYHSEIAPNSVHSTPDGWPSESYAELQHAKRILFGFGHVDAQMQEYNFTGDASTIFPQEYIQANHDVGVSSAGTVDTGCFFNGDLESVSSVNSSWSSSNQPSSQGSGAAPDSTLFVTATDLINCGISPILNQSLSNSTAESNISPYMDYVKVALWSWAPNQPANVSVRAGSTSQFRCAAINTTSPGSGQWQVADCKGSYYAACREASLPYAWHLSSERASYTDSNELCGNNATFSVPHTSLENRHLIAAIQRSHLSPGSDNLVWVDFNDLDVPGCWVSGLNQTCPYINDMNEQQRKVVVPVVAAVVVFVLAALTLFIKCAANRRSSKRRRKGENGWDYEGVPS
ncbi:Maintenance of telomere capping protein 6 [Elasticomyces elasticus]|nr:Maintenance of telomere capping protein 6 [Elasticomyces elasticus]